MTQVLSFYPITEDFRRDLEAKVGRSLTPRFLGEFRKPGPWQTWCALRALGEEELVLAVEEPEARAATALLLAVGAIFGPKGVRAFDRTLFNLPVSRAKGWTSLLKVVRDSLVAKWNMHRMARDVASTKWAPLPWRGGKRIAYLKTTLGYGVKAGGSVGHVAGVVNGLADFGLYPNVFANEPQPLVHREIPFSRLVPPSLFAFPAELNFIRFHLAVVDQVRRTLGSEAVDWIYQRLSTTNFSGAVLSRDLGLPLVVEYNGSEVWIAKNWGDGIPNESFAVAAEEALLRQASLIVTVSEVLREELLSRGLPDERILVHPNCVDPERYRPDLLTKEQVRARRVDLGIDPDEIVLTFLGTFGAWHGVDFLAESIRALYEQDPAWWEQHQIRLLLVGDGVLRAQAETLLAGIPRISFTGLVPQAEAPAYLALSDLLLSPHVDRRSDARFFGSPTKLFEYMAMGKAIVASDLEQIGEVLAPGHRVDQPFQESSTAVLFSPGDQDCFIRSLRWAVEHPEERLQMGVSARAKVLRKYTWQRYAECLALKLDQLPRGS